jgi:hypothetical protein
MEFDPPLLAKESAMATRTTSSPRTLVAIVVGLTVMVALMLLAFAAPALNSGRRTCRSP